MAQAAKPRRQPLSRVALAILVAIASGQRCASACAQEAASSSTGPTPQAQSTAPPAAAASEVTVVGRARDDRSTIDGHSYGLRRDLQKDTGSVADALSHVPGVGVTPDGEVSLRGDSDVTILVDGKPSALFSGAARAQALQATSAGQFERVEAMTNPSDSQLAEGGGGIINLISKAPSKPGAAPVASGSVKAATGSGDRFDVGANGTWSTHGLSLTGGVDYRRTGYGLTVESRYQLPSPLTGALAPAQGFTREDDRTDNLTLNGSAAYNLTPRDRLSFDVNVSGARRVDGQDLAFQSGPDLPPQAYVAPGYEHDRFASVSEALGYSHSAAGRSFTARLSLSQSHVVTQGVADYAFTAPVQPGSHQVVEQSSDFPQLDFKLEYATPLLKTGKLTTGYELKIDRQNYVSALLQGPSAALAVSDPAFAQRFDFDQQVHAFYATFEQKLGRLTLQPGVRLEETRIDGDLVTAGERARQGYFEAYPGLHLSYDLDPESPSSRRAWVGACCDPAKASSSASGAALKIGGSATRPTRQVVASAGTSGATRSI